MTPLTTVPPKECFPPATSGPKRAFPGLEPLPAGHLRPEKAVPRAGTATRRPPPAQKGHFPGLNRQPPAISGPKRPFPGLEPLPAGHFRPEKAVPGPEAPFATLLAAVLMTAALRLPDASLSPQAQYHDNTGRNRPGRASARAVGRAKPARAKFCLYKMQKIRSFASLLH